MLLDCMYKAIVFIIIVVRLTPRKFRAINDNLVIFTIAKLNYTLLLLPNLR